MSRKIDTQLFYQTLDSFYKNKQIEKAEPYMLETLGRAGELQDLEGVVAVCNELGGLYRAMRRTDEALWSYEKVMNGLGQMGMQGTKNYAAALINLGNVHIVRKEYDKAYEIDRQALAILERLGGDDYQLAALCNNMSAILREIEQTGEAERLARRAIHIIERMPERVIDLATSYTNLGQAQAKGYAYADARESLTHALHLFENYNGDRDTHYAIAVYALANVDYVEGHYKEAERGYLRAAELTERDFGHTSDYEQIMDDLRRVREKGVAYEWDGTVPRVL